MKANPVILVHGGAGYKPPGKKSLDVLLESLAAGYTILLNNGSSLDAVVAAVSVMENSGMFTCGYAKGKRNQVQAGMSQVRQ